MICPECGQEIPMGGWPFCKGGHEPVKPNVISDELIGGFVQENFGNTPEVFHSKRAMWKRADELGLRLKTEGDAKRGSFAVTSKTLNDARELLSRGTQTVDEVRCETATFTERVIRMTGGIA